MKKFFLLALGLTAIGLLLSYLRPPFFETLEKKLYDIHFALRGPLPSSGDVVLVTVDEKSLQRVGRWPWPRSLFAQIFEELIARGAKAVSPDIFFAEPSAGAQGEKHDLELAAALRKNPNLFIGYFMLMTPEELEESAVEPQTLETNYQNLNASVLPFTLDLPKIRKAVGIQDVLPLLSNLSGQRQGFFTFLGDSDGTVRETPVVISFRDKLFPSLPLQIAMNTLQRDHFTFLQDLGLDAEGDFLINYRGSSSAFPRISVADLLEGREVLSVKNKIVLFGATAAGLEDNRPTPLHPEIPSVVLTANIIDNMIQGDFLKKNPRTDLVSRLMIVLVGLVLGFFLARLEAAAGFLLFLGLTLAQALFLHLLFLQERWVLQNIYPLFSGFLVYGGTTLYRYLVEEKEKRFISDTFQHYLSADVIQELTNHPEKVRLGGERKELTVFFSDIRDFATVVETTPPEILVSFLNSYLTPVTDIILDQKGTLDKYIGDAVMAVFGAPLPRSDHAQAACQAATEIMKLVKSSQEKWQQEFNVPSLRIGIGLNTGLMTVGNMGSERRFDYTVIGDAVNLASRLEGLNKFYQTSVLVSHSTYEQAKGSFLFRELDQVQVKGKKETVRIYELLTDPVIAQERLLPLFAEGLQKYREGQFAEAGKLFEKCLLMVPADGPSHFMLERCRDLETNPPLEWGGITAFQKK